MARFSEERLAAGLTRALSSLADSMSERDRPAPMLVVRDHYGSLFATETWRPISSYSNRSRLRAVLVRGVRFHLRRDQCDQVRAMPDDLAAEYRAALADLASLNARLADLREAAFVRAKPFKFPKDVES